VARPAHAGLGTWLREPAPGGLSRRVWAVYLVLVANGLPAFVLLNGLPGHTRTLFVWTVVPPASAQLLGIMYTDALVLVVLGLLAPTWPRTRIVVVLIAWFAVAATIVTFFTLDPFLKHPWIHLAYWLTMYILLVVFAPLVLILEERAHGGRLAVEVRMTAVSRTLAALAALALGAVGAALIVDPLWVGDRWLWPLTPLVGRIIGVWFTALAVAYAWALLDGDWLRGRPMFWQGVPIGIALALVPALHSGDVRGTLGARPLLYFGIAGILTGAGVLATLSQRTSGPTR
jgi:hypothetical protein